MQITKGKEFREEQFILESSVTQTKRGDLTSEYLKAAIHVIETIEEHNLDTEYNLKDRVQPQRLCLFDRNHSRKITPRL